MISHHFRARNMFAPHKPREQTIITLFPIYMLFLISSINGQANFNTTQGFSATRLIAANTVRYPRTIVQDAAGDFLIVSERLGTITAIYQQESIYNTTIIVDGSDLGLNHGLVIKDSWIYASSLTSVYRWGYEAGQRERINTSPEIVITGMPLIGVHVTRTLLFDTEGRLYVSLGSFANADANTDRAKIRRFNITEIPESGIDFWSGEVVVDGVRNEVGLAFDSNGVLWGAGNNADMLVRDDLGGDIHDTNPGEELTKFDKQLGSFYGFPYCWTVDILENHTRGEQFAWPDFLNTTFNDGWCKNVSNNQPPTMVLPAHHAALGLAFYNAEVCDTSEGAFPCSMKGDLFITFHGSYNREPPGGYKVARIPIDAQTNMPTGEILDILFEPDPSFCGRCLRPVGLLFDSRGHLIVTSDDSSEVIRITYDD
ncbi:unnamed protein product [Orchesella dallaii]|uniref:Pyrroloquinoline quinone-dependent pyranose dehydrogenase beta-propeller domain-containing protein n=1 Tax=Orchesella dallaii TaxID=48710 RepID=A0ABP1QMU1_9HEXA